MNERTMRPREPAGRRHAGSVLVEILVAMVIALFMLSGLLAAFLGCARRTSTRTAWPRCRTTNAWR